LTLTRVHPQVAVDDVRAATAWKLAVADDLTETDAPTDEELDVLRALETKGAR
jgi:glutaconate CoA-transferase subunit B